MKQIESEIYLSWVNARPHGSHWGGTLGGRVFVRPRDEVMVEPSGKRFYYLWGTTLCHMSNNGVFYFYVTDRGNSQSNMCMSQTSKGRINALLPYGCITQKKWHNYYEHIVYVNDKPNKIETKLELDHWYKLKNGNVIKLEGMPISLTD